MGINKFKIPNRVIADIQRYTPTYTVSENYGRSGGYFGDYDESASGYKSICIYVQNGLAAYIELFKEIAKAVFQIQSGNQRKYPLLIFGFGNTDHLQHERKYFDFGFINDSYNVQKVAITIARISGDNLISPGIITELFPKTDIRSLYNGKTKIERDDLIIIIGKKDEVFFSSKLVDKITTSLKKQILFVEIEDENRVNYIFKAQEVKFN